MFELKGTRKMKALILNSGMGARMGDVVPNCPKCMTEVKEGQTILSRQFDALQENDVKEVIVTTGYFNTELENYCYSLNTKLNLRFVYNPIYYKTNYIYSIYLAKEEIKDDIIILHGDLIFDKKILLDMITSGKSCMAINYNIPLPEKDFKVVIEGDKIKKIGIEFFENAVAAWPLYYLNKEDWMVWLNKIIDYCEAGRTFCYAENAFNEISNSCHVYPHNLDNLLCGEVDTKEDLISMQKKLIIGKEK